MLSNNKKNDKKDILLINKPSGISSYDCIRKLKSGLNEEKIGHAGTLDPLAEGLLIIGIGSGTKKLNQYLKLPKQYEVEILFGKKTSTGDMEGAVIEEKRVNHLSKEDINKIIKSMEGVIKLPVPLYSAVKVSGIPLYRYARNKNKNIPKLPIKDMEIKKIELKNLIKQNNNYLAKIEMEVSSGTYVRSIVEEIGKRLGIPATTYKLKRTKIGDFELKDAISI